MNDRSFDCRMVRGFKSNTPMKLKKAPVIIGSFIAIATCGHAGTEKTSEETTNAVSNHGDFCDWWSGKPFTYQNIAGPFLQELRFEGRYQYQVGYLDGSDINDADFNRTFDEHRRFRLGVRTKMLNYFSTKVQLNLVRDARRNGGDLDWGYQSFDEAYAAFDLGKAMDGAGPFDSLKIKYGRQKYVLSREASTSSTKLLTVERSALANKVYGSARPTGFAVDAEAGDWTFYAALFSGGRQGGNNGVLTPLDSRMIYLGSVGYRVSDQFDIRLDAAYNDSDFGGGSEVNYRWATSLSAQYDAGRWGVMGDIIAGDNGGTDNGVTNPNRQGTFWGFIVMPYTWIVEDKLQGVLQYQYASASNSEGIRINSRYGRSGANTPPANLNGGRGDQHQSLYAGLNYYLCGHNAKIQGGVEYQTMDAPGGDFNTLTYLLAYRMYF